MAGTYPGCRIPSITIFEVPVNTVEFVGDTDKHSG